MNGFDTLFIVQFGIWPTLVMAILWLLLARPGKSDHD